MTSRSPSRVKRCARKPAPMPRPTTPPWATLALQRLATLDRRAPGAVWPWSILRRDGQTISRTTARALERQGLLQRFPAGVRLTPAGLNAARAGGASTAENAPRRPAALPGQLDLFDRPAQPAPRVEDAPAPSPRRADGLDAQAVDLAGRAVALSRVKAEGGAREVPTEGVVPVTNAELTDFLTRNELGAASTERLHFRLGVRHRGRLAVVGFAVEPRLPEFDGVRRLERCVELVLLHWRSDPGDDLARLALAHLVAVAEELNYERCVYYAHHGDPTPVAIEPSTHAPLPVTQGVRGHRVRWRADGEYESASERRPWIWGEGSKGHEARRASAQGERDALQVDEVLDWEDLVWEVEESLGRTLTDEEMEALANDRGFSFDPYSGYFWNPVEGGIDVTDNPGWGQFERWVIDLPQPQGQRLAVRRMEAADARALVPDWHSHLQRTLPVSQVLALGVWALDAPGRYTEHLRGVALVGRPSASVWVKGPIFEVSRVAMAPDLPPLAGVREGTASSEASYLLGVIERIAALLGYSRVVSTILLGERGSSYLGANWTPAAVTLGGEWSREGREREEAEQPGVKIRLEAGAGRATAPDVKAVRALMREAVDLVRAGRATLGFKPELEAWRAQRRKR